MDLSFVADRAVNDMPVTVESLERGAVAPRRRAVVKTRSTGKPESHEAEATTSKCEVENAMVAIVVMAFAAETQDDVLIAVTAMVLTMDTVTMPQSMHYNWKS